MMEFKTWYQRVMDALIEKQGTKSSGEKSQGEGESQCTEKSTATT